MTATTAPRNGTSEQLATLVTSLEQLAADAAYAGEQCAPVLLNIAELLKVALPAPIATTTDFHKQFA